MNIVLWVLQVLLAVMLILSGATKAYQYERAKASIPWVKDVPHGLTTFIGIAELLGGVALLLPLGFHVTRRDGQGIGMTAVLFILAAFVAYGRFMIVRL